MDTELPLSEREEALASLKKRRDFQAHLASFIVVNAAFWGLWVAIGDSYPWPAWITGLWAIGLVMNAFDVYIRKPISEDDVRHEIDRLRHEH